MDVPGYVALVREERYDDAVRLIRKDNPFPSACAYVCEHPCEAQCRRRMVDDAVNICGLKRFAVDHAALPPRRSGGGHWKDSGRHRRRPRRHDRRLLSVPYGAPGDGV